MVGENEFSPRARKSERAVLTHRGSGSRDTYRRRLRWPGGKTRREATPSRAGRRRRRRRWLRVLRTRRPQRHTRFGTTDIWRLRGLTQSPCASHRSPIGEPGSFLSVTIAAPSVRPREVRRARLAIVFARVKDAISAPAAAGRRQRRTR